MPNGRSINAFLSYGTDWKDFALGVRSSYVGGHDRTINVFDWQGLDAILPGEILNESLRSKIDVADIFIAFVDGDYNSNERKTRLELEYALDILRRRGGHLRIVMLLLCPESKNVLRSLPYPGIDRIENLAQEECYGENGFVFPPRDNPILHQRIVKLRDKHLADLRGSDTPVKDSTWDLSAIVLLDRAVIPDGEVPFNTCEGEAARAAGALLKAAGGRVFLAQPGWHSRLDLMLSFEHDDLREPAFVQVLSAATAPRSIKEPNLLERRLSQVTSPEVLRRSHLVFWSPLGEQRPAQFQESLQERSYSSPVFRGDSGEGLAQWLKPQLGLGLPAPVAAYQDVDNMVQHREALRREVAAVVEPALPKDPDDRELHAFDVRMLRVILSSLAKRRPIIIAHNIGLNQASSPHTLRKDTIKYFRSLAVDADEALLDKDVHPEEIFWLAIVQEGNPIVTAASLSIPLDDFKLSRWFVLGLRQTESGDVRFEQGQRRDAVVQRLRAWAQESARAEAYHA
jgi:hypothetical protein